MFEPIYIMLGQIFEKINEGGKDGYMIIKLSVPYIMLFELYNKFVKDGVAKIEDLPKEKKQKYWNIAKKYYSEEDKAIKASKAAYTLALITSTD